MRDLHLPQLHLIDENRAGPSLASDRCSRRLRPPWLLTRRPIRPCYSRRPQRPRRWHGRSAMWPSSPTRPTACSSAWPSPSTAAPRALPVQRQSPRPFPPPAHPPGQCAPSRDPGSSTATQTRSTTTRQATMTPTALTPALASASGRTRLVAAQAVAGMGAWGGGTASCITWETHSEPSPNR